jgi:hypothetical protein
MKKAFLQEREGHRHRQARIHLHDVLSGARFWKIGGQQFIVSKEDRAQPCPALSAIGYPAGWSLS